jgi:hypothetical protein
MMRRNAVDHKGRVLLGRGAIILLGAAPMTWPAIHNGYPLLYPDSMTYIGDGPPVARALFLHKFSEYYGMRSFIYSLGILPWHWNVTPWPVVAFQAVIAAYVIWLVVRSIVPRRPAPYYLALVIVLSLFTSLSWYVSVILPDILGPILYLCIYLLVFAPESLTRAEHGAVFLIAWWAVASHATHLMLGVGIFFLLALLLVLRRPFMQGRWRAVGEVAIIIVLAAGAQLALHAYLYGEPSLNGDRPPFLMARAIADGPGRWYLEQHCGEVKLAICDHVHNLPNDPDNFLWGSDGIWQNVDDDTQARFRQEEIPFVLATLRAYPREQLSTSVAAFWKQLMAFGLVDLDGSAWVLQSFDSVLPGGRTRYLESRQKRGAMPLEFFTSVQNWTILASVVVIGAFIPRLWRRGCPRIVGLSWMIISTVIANAMVTGTLSMVEDRFQSRVIWLLSLLAGLLLVDWLDQRQAPGLGSSGDRQLDDTIAPPREPSRTVSASAN